MEKSGTCHIIVYWGSIGIMEKKWQLLYYSLLGFYRDNGNENGNCYITVYWGSIGIMEKNLEKTI